MTCWEYFSLDIRMYHPDYESALGTQTTLNNAGSYGWELVAVVPAQDPDGRRFHTAIFKRPIAVEEPPLPGA
jgi:hypothetical protein